MIWNWATFIDIMGHRLDIRRDNLLISYGMKKLNMAMAGVVQWIKHRPANQKVTGLIPSQDTCLGCGPGPQ